MSQERGQLQLEGHTSRAFDGELATFHVRVLAMGGLVLDQVHEAVQAYTSWDRARAERVLQRDQDVDAYDVGADSELLGLLARRQPVASDLRLIVELARSVTELERAGDEAKKIARFVVRGGSQPNQATVRDARHLAQLAERLLRQALETLDRLDVQAVDAILAGDKELDAEYAAGMRRLLSRGMEDPRRASAIVEAAFVMKSLERIGDHARNVARHVAAAL